MAIPKYRPSLSFEQMKYIIECIESTPHSPMNISILKILRPMILKIQAGLTPPAFVASERKTLNDSLGFSPLPESKESTEGASLWNLHKSGAPLSQSQKDLAFEYAYTHDLMSPIEEMAYERSLTS